MGCINVPTHVYVHHLDGLLARQPEEGGGIANTHAASQDHR